MTYRYRFNALFHWLLFISGMTCSTQSCLFRCPNGQVLAPGGVWFYDMIQDIVTLSDITAMHIGQPQANITVSDLEKAVNYGLSDQRWTEELLKCVESKKSFLVLFSISSWVSCLLE